MKKKLCRIWFHEYFFRIFERIVKPSRRRRDQTEITELLNLWHKLWKKNCELPNQALISYQYSIYTSWPPEAIEKSCEGHNQANNLNLQTKTKGGIILLRSSVLALVVCSDLIPWISKQLLLCLGFETNKCKTMQKRIFEMMMMMLKSFN